MNNRLMSAIFSAALLLNTICTHTAATGKCLGGARVRFDVTELLNKEQGPLELKIIKYSLQQMVTVAASKRTRQPIDIDFGQLGAKLVLERDKNGTVTAKRAKSGSTSAKSMVFERAGKATAEKFSSIELSDIASKIKEAATRSQATIGITNPLTSNDFSVCLRKGENLILELTVNGQSTVQVYVVDDKAALKNVTAMVAADLTVTKVPFLKKGEFFKGDITELARTIKSGFINDLQAAIARQTAIK